MYKSEQSNRAIKPEGEVAIVYAFDKIKQLEMFKHSILSLKRIDSKHDILLIINEELTQNKDLNDFLKKIGKKVIVIPLNLQISGMFYWLLSPLITQYKYYIQVDNDTLFYNISIDDFVDKYRSKLKHRAFLGIRSYAWIKTRNSKIIKIFRKNDFDFYLRGPRYINTGVTLIDGERVRNILVESNYGLEHLFEYFKIATSNKFKKTDQEYLHIFWREELGFIDPKYNLRISDLHDMNRRSKSNSYIAHYNLHSRIDKKWKKFDFINKIESLGKDEFIEQISEFWSSSDERAQKNKKTFKKNISRMYDNLHRLVSNK